VAFSFGSVCTYFDGKLWLFFGSVCTYFDGKLWLFLALFALILMENCGFFFGSVCTYFDGKPWLFFLIAPPPNLSYQHCCHLGHTKECALFICPHHLHMSSSSQVHVVWVQADYVAFPIQCRKQHNDSKKKTASSYLGKQLEKSDSCLL
jgi:hypothetical protein